MLRLTGGEFNGRMITTPKGDRTRPTQARMRQAMFNSIQAVIPDARVLDLFAGSGALGFEALSRGALSCDFVEDDRATAKLIDKNARDLGCADRVNVHSDDAIKAVRRLVAAKPAPAASESSDAPTLFDLVLADPPYAAGFELRLLEELPWDRLLAVGGLLLIEWSPQKAKLAELPERTPFLVKTREKNYGDSLLTTYRREA